jgi:hypothetical protein
MAFLGLRYADADADGPVEEPFGCVHCRRLALVPWRGRVLPRGIHSGGPAGCRGSPCTPTSRPSSPPTRRGRCGALTPSRTRRPWRPLRVPMLAAVVNHGRHRHEYHSSTHSMYSSEQFHLFLKIKEGLPCRPRKRVGHPCSVSASGRLTGGHPCRASASRRLTTRAIECHCGSG